MSFHRIITVCAPEDVTSSSKASGETSGLIPGSTIPDTTTESMNPSITSVEPAINANSSSRSSPPSQACIPGASKDVLTSLSAFKDKLRTRRPSKDRITVVEARAPHPQASPVGDEVQLTNRNSLGDVWQCLSDVGSKVPHGYFRRHISIGTRLSYGKRIRPTLAPSRHRTGTWEFEYFKRCFYEYPLVKAPGASVTATCLDTGREIQLYDWVREEDSRRITLMIITRKCSFWSGKRADGDGSDAVILCEPLPTEISINGRDITLEAKNFQDGYADPALDSVDLASLKRGSQPVTPLFDSLSDFFHKRIDSVFPLEGLLTSVHHPAALWLFRVIAAEYEHLLAFTTSQTTAMRSRGWSLRRRDSTERAESAQVERDWAQFRCAEFLEALMAGIETTNMSIDSLFHPEPGASRPRDVRSRSRARSPSVFVSLPGEPSRVLGSGAVLLSDDRDLDWAATQRDFHWLHQEFRQRRLDYDRVSRSIAALASIQETFRSNRLAERTGRITFVLLVFTPLALLADYLGMDGIYLPGGGRVWVYPMSVGVIVAAAVGYLAYQRVMRWRRERDPDALDTAEMGMVGSRNWGLRITQQLRCGRD